MLSKLSLIMLMMLVSLLGYCQYPTTKIIGKDTVVIMTVKQGEEINKKFSEMNDSLKSLLSQSYIYKGRSIVLSRNLSELDSTYKVTRTQFDSLQIVHLADVRLYKQRETMWRKDRRDFSIFSVAAVLLALFVSIIN